jgi:hypothetical protein
MNVDVTSTARNLEGWHVIFGHCNQKDVLKNASNVSGMEID